MAFTATVPRYPALVAAMVLQFAMGGAVIPFISVLLQDRGVTDVQFSRMVMVAYATLLVVPFVWGVLADRWIPLNRLFAFINCLVLGSLVFLSHQTEYLGLFAGFVLFFASFNPTLMLMNPLCFYHLPDPRSQFGRLRAWGSLGWIVPSLPIYVWLLAADGPALDFVLVVGMGLAAAMALFSFWLPHTPPGAAHAAPAILGQPGYWREVRTLLSNGPYLVLLASFFLMMGSFSILTFFSPLHLTRLGMDRALIGPIQCLGVVIEIVLFWWGGAFLKRFSYGATIQIGCLCLVLRHALFAWSDNLWLLAASYFLAGMVVVFYHTGVSVFVNALAAPAVRSTAQTLLLLCSGLGPIAANAVAIRLTAGTAPGHRLNAVFLFAAVLAGIASVLIVLWNRKLNSATQS